jgi:hypothetical protein
MITHGPTVPPLSYSLGVLAGHHGRVGDIGDWMAARLTTVAAAINEPGCGSDVIVKDDP